MNQVKKARGKEKTRPVLFVYYKSRKRELKAKLMNESVRKARVEET